MGKLFTRFLLLAPLVTAVASCADESIRFGPYDAIVDPVEYETETACNVIKNSTACAASPFVSDQFSIWQSECDDYCSQRGAVGRKLKGKKSGTLTCVEDLTLSWRVACVRMEASCSCGDPGR